MYLTKNKPTFYFYRMELNKLYHDIIDNFDDLKYALLDAQTFDPKHYGFPEIYYKIMETDQLRVNAFRRAFAHYNNLKDAVVCEAGIGRLALTQHYLPYVKKAYLIENNPNIVDFIKETLAKNGWTNKVELIIGDAMKVQLPEKVDYLIGELMSIYCANEYQVQIFKHLRKFLKPEGRMMPEKIHNLVQLGNAEFEHGHKHYPILFTRHWPELLSNQVLLNTIDLHKASRYKIKKKVKLQNFLSGEANCVYMNSLVQMAEGINFTGTDSLMPPTVLKLTQPANLKAGEKSTLQANFTYGTSLDQAAFTVL